ncbi:hypothetical protein ZWY2020_011790 [Hordeum vulgare]|nr:hypothetical protein ZWY2020_011790 [Hordeum vulgare]
MTILSTASAAIYNVGEPGGAWDLSTNYGTWATASPIATLNSGNDVVSLTATGTRYFICGFPGHCAGGMKVKIDVVPSSSSSSPAPASGPSASNAPPPVPVSAATSVATTGFGLAILLIVAGLMS